MAKFSALARSHLDPTPIFELYRGNYATELLTAAVAHFRVFERLAGGPLEREKLRGDLGLAQRPFVVLLTALRAMQLIAVDAAGRFELTPLAREHLVPGDAFDVSQYMGLSADAPGVRDMIERLSTNSPLGHKPEEQGVGFIYRDDLPSAMEQEATARHFTLALAGRAKNVAPYLAERLPLESARTLVDVGGGTGIYSIACLEHHPHLRATVWDRPEVLKVAAEMARDYGVEDRLELQPGDMFVDPVPTNADVMLLSNILHDWDVPECQTLIGRCAAALPSGGRLVIHDVFLNDALDGPLPLALYSAALFSFTQGRAYSAAEYRTWLTAAGLRPEPIMPTLVHCGLLSGVK
jgi:ubiquinone/menaquinone biosynthesis C-methylase UbiE